MAAMPANRETTSTAALALAAGRAWLGTPYAGGTLEVEGPERLTIELSRFDCFTLVESCLASAQAAKGDGDFAAFAAALRRLRYRDGRIDGYPSRLHYTVDWAHDNERKGLVRDLTAELGGEPLAKEIHFMTRHRDKYPKLKDQAFFEEMVEVERAINQRKRFFIPKARIPDIESRIHDGDILAMVAGIDGLDVVHVGFAIHQDDRLHLLHASSRSKRVEITPRPLADYMAGVKSQIGLMVFRPLNP